MTEGPNHGLFVRVLAQIEKHPETWDQRAWANECQTAFCMAGWACQLNGRRWSSAKGLSMSYYVQTPAGGWRRAKREAADLLGIPLRSYEPLFDASNDLDDLYLISADLLGIDETVLRDKVAAEVAA